MENQSNISSQKENKEQLPFTLYRHFDSNDNLLYVSHCYVYDINNESYYYYNDIMK